MSTETDAEIEQKMKECALCQRDLALYGESFHDAEGHIPWRVAEKSALHRQHMNETVGRWPGAGGPG